MRNVAKQIIGASIKIFSPESGVIFFSDSPRREFHQSDTVAWRCAEVWSTFGLGNRLNRSNIFLRHDPAQKPPQKIRSGYDAFFISPDQD